MTTLSIFWISTSIIFLIVEMITVTFYGLAIAISAAITGMYVAFTGDTQVTMMQGILFVVMSAMTSYFLPKVLTSNISDQPQGLDIYIGTTHKIKSVENQDRIVLDGVAYIYVSEDDVLVDDMVQIVHRDGAIMHVKKI